MYAETYSFGMVMPNRSLNADGQRYLFHGMEQDPELKGAGNSYTTEFRQYDPRLGRWKSIDPLMSMFPKMSPYNAFANNPIVYTDPEGLAPTTQVLDGDGNVVYDDGKDDGIIYRFHGTCEQMEEGDFDSWQKEGLLDQLTKPVNDKVYSVKWISKNETLEDFVNERWNKNGFDDIVEDVSFEIVDKNGKIGYAVSGENKVRDSDNSKEHLREIKIINLKPMKDWKVNIKRDKKGARRNLLPGVNSVFDLDNILSHERGHIDLYFNIVTDFGFELTLQEFGIFRVSIWGNFNELYAINFQKNHESWGMTSKPHQTHIYGYQKQQIENVLRIYNLKGHEWLRDAIKNWEEYNLGHWNATKFEDFSIPRLNGLHKRGWKAW